MFNIILAQDSNNGIGNNNSLPWNEPKDMAHFKHCTTLNEFNDKNIIIMGRKTFQSIKNTPLKNRINIVISNTLKESEYENINDLYFADNFCNALNLASKINKHNTNKIWVIGGKQVYESAIKHKDCNYIYRTVINSTYDCDTFFQIHNFKVVSQKNEENLRFQILKPKFYDENKYLQLLEETLYKGEIRQTRNANTYSLFNRELEFDVSKSFPLLTTKRMFWKGVTEELLFFLRGETDSKKLEKKGVNIWRGNTSGEFLKKVGLNYDEGDMGPMYGYQWRSFNKPYFEEGYGIDQLSEIIDLIKNDPHSRRIIMTNFNPLQVNQGVLYPCHSLILQFYVSNNNLSVKMYQRSADLFLGLPFNIASTSLLLYIIANATNLKPHKVSISLGDCHIYENHRDQVLKQLDRIPFDFPKLIVPEFDNLDDFLKEANMDTFKLIDYHYHPGIKANMVA
jgi:dihydrofolate reductase / thymidylate synthase